VDSLDGDFVGAEVAKNLLDDEAARYRPRAEKFNTVRGRASLRADSGLKPPTIPR
jgi:hypothetical protein